ncbi:MAG: plasmid pRiA4b ORF-3 family protein [Pseudomonadota bacterium]|nr:plasmid pRiA4b ORF-3 family protein [Pseudomonadota bacterium]
MPKRSLAVLKITLDGVEPKVKLRIAVRSDIRLDRLHLAIQAAMGWTNSHLCEFHIGGAGWGVPDPDGIYDGPMDVKTARLSAVLVEAGRKTFSYTYDFGDGWSMPAMPIVDRRPPIVVGIRQTNGAMR